MEAQTYNADFSALYNYAHPLAPVYVTEVLCTNLGYRPKLIVDLGCGTGLSCIPWHGIATRIIGIEPDKHMRKWAERQIKHFPEISLRSGLGEKTGLPNHEADIVTCAQSFDCMDASAVLQEADRLLVSGGVFAIYDYDWPPICCGDAERAYQKLSTRVKKLLLTDPEPKPTQPEYLQMLENSGYFAYTSNVVFVSREICDFARLAAIAKCEPHIQTLLQTQPDALLKLLDEYEHAIWSIYGEEDFLLDFCYHMYVGIKPEEK